MSGFYGSGKSHLLRVLEHLWRDVELPGGDRARDLVSLPDDVSDHLAELSTAGKRLGGLWSAAGTLAAGKGDAVRLAFLSVLFESAGLPEEYPLARFTIWAQENGYLDTIRSAISAAGRTFEKEIHDLYVSPVIAKSLLDADPSLGDSVKDVRDLLKTQFPPTTKDITDGELFDAIDDVLRLQSTPDGKMPLTLVVLDEMQQYINDDNVKATDVQLLVEGCRDRYESRLLIVATGQDDLGAISTSLRGWATPVKTLSGTPPYQAPDADYTRWDVTTDLFAVGVVLYELLCNGEHPYPGGKPMVGEEVRDPRSIRPDLSAELAKFLVNACAPDRGSRFATAQEMKHALEEIRATG